MRLDEAARQFLGVPYQHQGRDPAIALDCVGVLCAAAAACEMPEIIYDSTAYGKDPVDGQLERHLALAFGDPWPVTCMQPGDVVAMRELGAVRHVAIVGEHPHGGFTLIHSHHRVGKVIEQGMDLKLHRRIVRVYRPRIST